MPLLCLTALLRIAKTMLTNSSGSSRYFFSDFIVNVLKASLLILLFAIVFNSLYHTESFL